MKEHMNVFFEHELPTVKEIKRLGNEYLFALIRMYHDARSTGDGNQNTAIIFGQIVSFLEGQPSAFKPEFVNFVLCHLKLHEGHKQTLDNRIKIMESTMPSWVYKIVSVESLEDR